MVEELRDTKATDYRTVLLAFVNCLIISTPQLKVEYHIWLIVHYTFAACEPMPILPLKGQWQRPISRKCFIFFVREQQYTNGGLKQGSTELAKAPCARKSKD